MTAVTGNPTTLTDMVGRTTKDTKNTNSDANWLASSFSSSSSVVLTNQVVGTQARRYSYTFRSQLSALTDTNSAAYACEFDGDGNRRKETIAGTARRSERTDGVEQRQRH